MGTRAHLQLALVLRGVGASMDKGEGWNLVGMGESRLVQVLLDCLYLWGPAAHFCCECLWASDMAVSRAIWRGWGTSRRPVVQS